MNINTCVISGNITADLETKYTPNGTAVLQFTVAVNRKYKTAEGEPKEEVSFIKVVVFGKTAEVVAQYCSKGTPVCVQGRLKQERWEAENGQKRDKTVLIGENIQFYAKRDNQESEAGA